MKKIILSLTLMLVLAVGTFTVFAGETAPATGTRTNVEILAELTGKTAEEIVAAVKEGKTLSVQAQEAGKFDAFVTAIKAEKIARIDALVASGKLTAERAEVMKAFIENHTCDGTQQFAMRQQLNNGERFGLGMGMMKGARNFGDGAETGKGFGGFGRGAGGMMRGQGGVCFNSVAPAQ